MDDREFEKLMSAVAVRQVQLLNDSFPTDAELDKIVVSENFEQNVQKIIAKGEKKQKRLYNRKRLNKIAASFAIIAVISFGTIMSVDASRASFIQFFERCFSISSNKNVGWDTDFNTEIAKNCHHVYLPSWMPDGLRATESLQGDKGCFITYKSKDQIVRFTQNDNLTNFLNDSEIQAMEQISLFNQIYYYGEKSDVKVTTRKLVWKTNQNTFTLVSTISKDELLKIAQNLVFKES